MTDAYLSHPVRQMRDDPVPGEDATLVVDVAGADTRDDPAVETVAEAIDAIGVVEERLRFGSVRVRLPQDRLDALCAIGGIAAVETAMTRSFRAGDAGEDLEPFD